MKKLEHAMMSLFQLFYASMVVGSAFANGNDLYHFSG